MGYLLVPFRFQPLFTVEYSIFKSLLSFRLLKNSRYLDLSIFPNTVRCVMELFDENATGIERFWCILFRSF